MKKVEYSGLLIFVMLLSGIAMTLYPRRIAIATEDVVTEVAKNYTQMQLFKVMMALDKAQASKNDKSKEIAINRAKKASKKARHAAEYAQKVLDNAIKSEADLKKDMQKTGMKRSEKYKINEARDMVIEINQIANYAQALVQQVTAKPDPVTKKEKVISILEEEL